MKDVLKNSIPFGKVQSTIENVRSSIWFVPTVFIVSFIVLSQILLQIDHVFFEQINKTAPWLFTGSSDAARNLLSTIATSIITIVSISFSITIIALQQASTQYSPRVLRTFTSDKKNQIVLGMYIATFTYALLILRSVRSSDGAIDTGFVPALSVTVAILFVLICMGILIFFIHQVASSLQVSEIIKHVHNDLIHEIDSLFPQNVGKKVKEPVSAETIMKKLRKRKSSVVMSERAGFVQFIDQQAFSQIEIQGAKWLYIRVRNGSFVKKGDALVEVDTKFLSQKTKNVIQNAVIISNQPSINQDALFGITQLVDIALRALSPGINDPRTATYCLYYLSDALCRLSQKKFPDNKKTFTNNRITFVFNRPSWETYVVSSFNQIRRDAKDSFRVTLALLDVLFEISSCISKGSKRGTPLLVQVKSIEETISERVYTKEDRKIFKEKIRLLKKNLRDDRS